MAESLVPCRPRTNLSLLDVLFQQPDVVPVCVNNTLSFVQIVLRVNTERHVFRPGVAPKSCPNNPDGAVYVADRSAHISSVNIVYVNPAIIELQVKPTPGATYATAFVRLKYEEDMAITGQEKPRRIGVAIGFMVPKCGATVQPQVQVVTE